MQIREYGHVYMIESPLASVVKTSFINFTAIQIASFDTSMAELMVVDLIFKDPSTKRFDLLIIYFRSNMSARIDYTSMILNNL